MAQAPAAALTRTFGGAAPHVVDADTGVSLWFTSPPGLLAQVSTGTFVDGDVAGRITATSDLRVRFPKAARFNYVFDFRNAVGYNTHARQILTTWGLSQLQAIERLAWVPPASNVFRMGLSTVMVALRAAGLESEIIETLEDALARLRLRPA